MLQSGSDAYPFILNDIDGDPMMIEGNAPPTLLIFFEADCQTCQLTFSYLNRLFEMIAPNGGRIFGISQDARRETRTFIEQTGCKFPILFDQGLKVSREYDPEAVPAVFLLDRNFKVSRTMIGFNKAHLNAAAKEMMLTLGMSYDILALDFDGNPNYKSGSMPRHRESETLIEGPAWPDLSVRGGGEDAGVESPIEVLPAVSVPGPAPSAAGTHVHIEESVKLPSIAIIDPGIEVRELETNGEHAGFAASRVLVHEEHDPQEFCAERGYGDGLPVIPPTLARVEKFLARTDVPPEEIIARISPARSAATVEKIAANGVMAGCAPETMKLLIALTRAVGDEKFARLAQQCRSPFSSPLIILNGPVRDELGFGRNEFPLDNPGRTEAALTRALVLILKNLGGVNPGIAAFCIAESEDETPWEPFHLSRGLQRDQSAISLAAAEPPLRIGGREFENHTYLLQSLCSALAVLGGNPSPTTGDVFVSLCPSHVQLLRKAGFEKSGVRRYLFENALAGARTAGSEASPESASAGPEDSETAEQSGKIRKFQSPDKIHLIVAGRSASGFSAVFGGQISSGDGDGLVTVPIE